MAIENGVQNAELGYILDPAFQIENINGKPAVGGHIEIFEAGTDNKYISYQNFDGAQNPFKIPLGADGRAVILGDPSLSYDVYAYDSYNNLMFSRLNVQCNVPGNISIKGADTRINNTDGTLDISLRTLGNNVRQYTINTHNKELGVQGPLFFVRNDNSATIIGFSGDGFAKEDKFDYDENYNITGYDGSAFARTTYSAGDYVDITDDTISVTGLQPSGNYASASDVATLEEKLDDKLDTSAFNESAVIVNNFQYEGDKITAYNNSAFVGADYEAGQYVDITDDRISVTGVQPAGNYASASDVTELNNKLANKLDTSAAFTKASADTLYQPIGDYATHDDLTAYATTSLVSSVSSTITGMIPTSDYELVAGSGVELVDDPTAHTKTINVTAEGTPVTAIEQMIESATSGLQPSGDYATTADLTAKQDTLDYGYHDAAISSIDASALYDTSAHARINTLAGRISNLSSDKLDTTAFSTVSGDFLTAHQDISNKLDTTAFSNVSGNFLTAVPDTYLQNTDLTIVDNKITEISGVPLSAGDELPASVSAATDYVTATSGDINATIDNVSANSGVWGGSALPISAGPGIKVELVDNTLVFSNDETVLWSGTYQGADTITLSEALSNFDLVRIEWCPYTEASNWLEPKDSVITKVFNNEIHLTGIGVSTNYTYQMLVNIALQVSDTTVSETYHTSVTMHNGAVNENLRGYKIFKIVGINRISGGN